MSETAARYEEPDFLERRFKFAANGTTLARDTMAGVTTFIVMSYIIFVNPQILSFSGIEGLRGHRAPVRQVLAATCVVAGGDDDPDGPLHEPGLRDRARARDSTRWSRSSLVANEGLSFPAAMGLIVVEGIAVTILVLTGMREKIMDAIPLDLKKAIAIGIGLFIAFIGLVNSGVVVRGDAGRRPRPAHDVAALRHVLRARLHDRAARARCREATC